jgi:molybdopterin biosynthesis enzyme
MDEALRLVAENADEPKIVEVKLKELRTGDIIARDLRSPYPQPRFRTSRMDGYALKCRFYYKSD